MSLIIKKLDTWKSKLNYFSEQSDTAIYTPSIDLNQNPGLLVDALRSNIDEKFSKFIRKTFDEFKNINALLKRKGYWLIKLESNKPNFVEKVLIRGYFSIDFSIKKLKLS